MTLEERIQQCEDYKDTYNLLDVECNIKTEVTDTDIILKSCNDKETFIVPEFISIIGEEAFSLNTDIRKLILHNSVTEIREGAFFECSSLEEINIPNSVTEISGEAFGWCKSLTNIAIYNSVTNIGYAAFKGCDSLRTLIIPYRFQSEIKKLDVPSTCKIVYI